jgi:alpha-methylacyl-CoA racemase
MTESGSARNGPLVGVRVLELGGIGPAPFAGMLLAEMGAEVLRVDPPWDAGRAGDLLQRGKLSVLIDLKHSDGRQAAIELASRADILLEDFGPGWQSASALGLRTVQP